MRSSFTLPWGAWFGDRPRRFELAPGHRVEVCRIHGGRLAGRGAVRRALDEPIGAPALADLARGRRDACVVVEDITRPARLAEVLPEILEEIIRAGIPAERIRILIGCGGHAPLDRPHLIRKLGSAIVARYDIWNHMPYENLVDLGTSARGIPIRINKLFHDADLKIAVGSVVPHPYAGFGGGAKIVLPGVSGIETLEANHRPAVTGVHGGLNDVENNTARHEMEEIAMRAGLEAVVNIVTDDRRRTLGVFYGHPVAAHRAAVGLARKAYATRAPREPADVVVLNAYPKDAELLQVGNAFNVLRSSKHMPVRPGGTVVVTAACPLGRGYHALHGPAMRLYRTPIERTYLEGRPVIFHAPSLNAHDARISFWDGYPFERKWSAVMRRLVALHGPKARVAVFPCAPLQLLEE